MPNNKIDACKQAAQWNSQHPVGTPVILKLSAQPGEIDRRTVTTTTTSAASAVPMPIPGDYWIAVVDLQTGGRSGINSVKAVA